MTTPVSTAAEGSKIFILSYETTPGEVFYIWRQLKAEPMIDVFNDFERAKRAARRFAKKVILEMERLGVMDPEDWETWEGGEHSLGGWYLTITAIDREMVIRVTEWKVRGVDDEHLQAEEQQQQQQQEEEEEGEDGDLYGASDDEDMLEDDDDEYEEEDDEEEVEQMAAGLGELDLKDGEEGKHNDA